MTIRGKIGTSSAEALSIAKTIKKMEQNHPGKSYKFSYMVGEESDFDNVITYLNAALLHPDVAHNRIFTRADFIKTPFNE